MAAFTIGTKTSRAAAGLDGPRPEPLSDALAALIRGTELYALWQEQCGVGTEGDDGDRDAKAEEEAARTLAVIHASASAGVITRPVSIRRVLNQTVLTLGQDVWDAALPILESIAACPPDAWEAVRGWYATDDELFDDESLALPETAVTATLTVVRYWGLDVPGRRRLMWFLMHWGDVTARERVLATMPTWRAGALKALAGGVVAADPTVAADLAAPVVASGEVWERGVLEDGMWTVAADRNLHGIMDASAARLRGWIGEGAVAPFAQPSAYLEGALDGEHLMERLRQVKDDMYRPFELVVQIACRPSASPATVRALDVLDQLIQEWKRSASRRAFGWKLLRNVVRVALSEPHKVTARWMLKWVFHRGKELGIARETSVNGLLEHVAITWSSRSVVPLPDVVEWVVDAGAKWTVYTGTGIVHHLLTKANTASDDAAALLAGVHALLDWMEAQKLPLLCSPLFTELRGASASVRPRVEAWLKTKNAAAEQRLLDGDMEAMGQLWAEFETSETTVARALVLLATEKALPAAKLETLERVSLAAISDIQTQASGVRLHDTFLIPYRNQTWSVHRCEMRWMLTSVWSLIGQFRDTGKEFKDMVERLWKALELRMD
jgi:hypothetical protein